MWWAPDRKSCPSPTSVSTPPTVVWEQEMVGRRKGCSVRAVASCNLFGQLAGRVMPILTLTVKLLCLPPWGLCFVLPFCRQGGDWGNFGSSALSGAKEVLSRNHHSCSFLLEYEPLESLASPHIFQKCACRTESAGQEAASGRTKMSTLNVGQRQGVRLPLVDLTLTLLFHLRAHLFVALRNAKRIMNN